MDSGPVRLEVFGIGSANGADRLGWMVLEELDRKGAGGLVLHRLQTPLDLLNYAMAGLSQGGLISEKSATVDEGLISEKSATVVEGLISEKSATVGWILVDACLGECVGKIHCWRWPQVPQGMALASQVSSHGFGILDVLRMGEELGLLPSQIQVVGIEVGGDLECSGQESMIGWTPSEALGISILRCAEWISGRR